MLVKQERPFFAYLVTLMMHHPFPAFRREEKLLKLPADLDETMLGRYLQQAAVSFLVEKLKEKELWDNTILVLCGDHRSRMPLRDKKLLEIPSTPPESDTVFMLIHCPGGQPRGMVKGPVGQLDLMPTLLHLLGVDGSRALFLGTNLLSPERPPVVARGRVIADDFVVEMGREPLVKGRFEEGELERALEQYRIERGASETVIYEDSIIETLNALNERTAEPAIEQPAPGHSPTLP